MITVQVPATTANLGPGFDCFGMALTLYGRFTFEELPAGLCFEGVPEAFCNADNLAVRAYFSALKAINLPQAGLFLRIASDIPVSHGLGSSASLIAAGIFAANAAHGSPLSKQQMLTLATALEGHPDNVAPALLGGLTVSMMTDRQAIAVPCPVSERIHVCALVPDFELSTHRARAVLPQSVPFADAVFNVSRRRGHAARAGNRRLRAAFHCAGRSPASALPAGIDCRICAGARACALLRRGGRVHQRRRANHPGACTRRQISPHG